MLRVGLTGGVASGKSTVAGLLAERGAAVLDADQVVEALYRPGGAGTIAVEREFGRGVMSPEGGVNRRALAERVLSDPQARRRLEALVHPLVQGQVASWLDARAETSTPVAVVEAALLVETGSWRQYHRLVVVEAPLHLRRQRALSAGWSEAAFAAVVAAQLDDPARRAVASYVLRNDGDEIGLRARVARLWQLLLADRQRCAAGLPLPREVMVVE
ncbi:MAG: dephospho-CoA kinase [Acidobacteriota bacterium]